MKSPQDIIQNVRITEKSNGLAEKRKYVFVVAPTATKQEIRYAVKSIFKKDVESVNTLRVRGKKKRERTAAFGQRPNWKKAIVTLKEGQTLELI
jgi:large subunit ribosomal protein L23